MAGERNISDAVSVTGEAIKLPCLIHVRDAMQDLETYTAIVAQPMSASPSRPKC